MPDLEPMNGDSEAIYDEQIAPLMTQIINICRKNRIPMLATFQYGNDEEAGSDDFCTTRIPFDGENPCLEKAMAMIRRHPAPAVFGVTITSTKP